MALHTPQPLQTLCKAALLSVCNAHASQIGSDLWQQREQGLTQKDAELSKEPAATQHHYWPGKQVTTQSPTELQDSASHSG